MKYFKTKKYSILLNILRYSFIGVFVFAMMMSSVLLSNNSNKADAAIAPAITVLSTTSNSVTLNIKGLTIGSSYRINLINSANVIGNNYWDFNASFSSEVTTTSPITSPLSPDTYTANLSDGSSYVATSSSFTITQASGGAPKITGFTPSSGLPATTDIPGDVILIMGSNFTGVTQVRFGEIVSVTPDTINDNSIQVTVPRAAVTGKLYLIKPGFPNTESATDFIVNSTNGTSTGSTTTPDSTTTTTQGTTTGTITSNSDVKFKGLVPICNTIVNSKTGTFDDPCDFNVLVASINNLINYVLFYLATPIFVLIIIYVAWLYLSDMGSVENVSKAKKIIKNALVGYIIALAAWLIVKTILVTVGFNPKDAFLSV